MEADQILRFADLERQVKSALKSGEVEGALAVLNGEEYRTLLREHCYMIAHDDMAKSRDLVPDQTRLRAQLTGLFFLGEMETKVRANADSLHRARIDALGARLDAAESKIAASVTEKVLAALSEIDLQKDTVGKVNKLQQQLSAAQGRIAALEKKS